MAKTPQTLLGFLPDLNPDTPGVMTECRHMIPYEQGFMAAPTPSAANAAALAGECRGAKVITKLDGTRRIFAGTQTKLYELTGTTWTDRSAGGGSYVGSVDSRWIYCQFGDTTMATNLADAMQSSTTGAFAAIAGAPRAKVVVSASNNFVIAFNTVDAGFGTSPDRWWNCAQNDQTNWVPSVASGAASGRLIATPGPIQAALPLGDYVIAYKERGIYVGTFVGAAQGSWQWNLAADSALAGAVGAEAVCEIAGGAHFIVGADDFWIFDGTSRPLSVGQGIRDWFRLNASQTYLYRAKCAFDAQRNIVWVSYVSTANTTGAVNDACLAFYLPTRKWGADNFNVEAMLTFTAPGTTIDGLDAYAATIDTLPAVPFDSAYWLSGARSFGFFDATHRLSIKGGTPADSGWTTGDMGDDDVLSLLESVRIRFYEKPTTAQAQHLYAMNEGDALEAGTTEQIYDGRFEFQLSARWHRLKFDMTGQHKEGSMTPTLSPESLQ